MKIALVIPFYNEEADLSQCLDSVKELFRRLESVSHLVLVDNNSTDASVSIIKGFQKRNPQIPILLEKESVQGEGYARIHGLSHAATLGVDMVLTTDADTVFISKKIPVLLKELRECMRGGYSIYAGGIMPDPEMYIKRILFFSEFVAVRRKLWNLHGKLFGPYFFGGLFGIDPKFYTKLLPYLNLDFSPIGHEDILMSKRAYYMGGKFYCSDSTCVITSGRRFLSDPLSWILGKREKDFRMKKGRDEDDKLQKISTKFHGSSTIYNKIIEVALMHNWQLYVDALMFYALTKGRFPKARSAIKRFESFMAYMPSIQLQFPDKTPVPTKQYKSAAREKLSVYLNNN